jgi:pilus assembly protein CpaB
MNPRQRRGLLFMLLAVVIGAGIFVAVTRYVSDVASQVGSQTTVYQATAGIDPYVPLSAQNIEPIQVPQRWTSPASRLQLRQIEGRRAGFRIEPGTVISADMLIPPSDLSPTEREIAINVNAVTGVGGRVRPGDSVDIYAVFADVPGLPKQVRVLVRNVRVVSIGGRQTVSTADAEGLGEKDVLPVTLALEPQDALSVTYANAFAKEVRLVGLPTDVGASRGNEGNTFDAGQLGGKAVPEGGTP